MSYQFDGKFFDLAWTELPSPDEVKVSVTKAIAGSSPQVFGIEVDRADVTTFEDHFLGFIPAGWISADVVVRWDVDE